MKYTKLLAANLAPETFAVALSFAILAAGCAHEPRTGILVGGEPLPKPPNFMAGPAGILLTNSPGFSARVELEYPPATKRKPLAGRLVARGSLMLFDPAVKAAKHPGATGYGFIWDAASGKGYIMSEALQGYAPIDSTNRFTNLMAPPSSPITEKLDGHTVERTTLSVSSGDGQQSKLEVSRASDLGGLPVRIVSIDEAIPTTVKLTEVRLETISEKLFLPPDGFTAYPTEQAMIDELTLREHGGRRGGVVEPGYNDLTRTHERGNHP